MSGTHCAIVLSLNCGTGKMMAAVDVVFAHEALLFRVELFTVISKGIGETTKKLKRLSHTIEERGAILFVDEAITLFGKRTEVKYANDRYANIDVDYLLKRMEEFHTLAILASNMMDDHGMAHSKKVTYNLRFTLLKSC